ncbi:MAG: hypothetical protein HC860_10285 [Alkalinema sp. RU_4_3]|nr:hypothetical protein [Alkalinema sp. RU_4_3]
MQESSIYRSIQDETAKTIALNCLRQELFSVEIIARATGLSIEQLQQLQQQIDTVPCDRSQTPQMHSPTECSNPAQ